MISPPNDCHSILIACRNWMGEKTIRSTKAVSLWNTLKDYFALITFRTQTHTMQCNSLNSSLASSLNFHFPLFSVDDGDGDGFQRCFIFFALHNVTQCKHHAKQSIFFKLELDLRWEKRWYRHFSVDVWMSGISNSTDLMCSLCYHQNHDKCWLHRTQPNRTEPNQSDLNWIESSIY